MEIDDIAMASFEIKIEMVFLNDLTEKVKNSPWLRCDFDLRNSSVIQSQLLLNAVELGTIMPIHGHKGLSMTCVRIRGYFEECFYNA